MIWLALLAACNKDDAADSGEAEVCPLPAAEIPACGSGAVARGSVIPGPADPGWDSALDARAAAVDRQAVGVTSFAAGTSTEVVVYDEGKRAALSEWIASGEGLTYGGDLAADVDYWSKVAGAYGGVNIAADAFRYGALRDEGADCDQVEEARVRLLAALDTLHMAQAITGVEGVIARGFATTALPGTGADVETTPLFDEDGDPLPEEKNNGTWREDSSGLYPELRWEDSCSRDQYIGWIAGMGAAWEVIFDDPSIGDRYRQRLQEDALALALSLMVERESGYDMEIMDADGRMTYHGILHQESFDRTYLPDGENSLNAVMGLGIIAVLELIADSEEVSAYLDEQLIADRELPRITGDWLRAQILLGTSTNYSNVNMAFIGGWLSDRYVCDEEARAEVGRGLVDLYGSPGSGEREPSEQDQALYDLVYAMSLGGATARASGGESPDEAAITKVIDVLTRFRPAPFWNEAINSCDDAEIEAGECTLENGEVVGIIGYSGHNDTLVADTPIPMEIRPPSNYYWRSDPYAPNGDGDGTALYPSVDWRFVYWAGRWARR